jgi:sugar fermentation stimulation protein A
MKFHAPLIQGRLIKRYKRFLSDIELADGTIVVAHCANSGSMLGVCDPGSEVWLSPAKNPDRKLRYTWELIRCGGGLVGINTSYPNAIVAEAITDGTIAELGGYASLRREVKYGKNSRIDLLLEGPKRPPCYVEIKNVTMRRGKEVHSPAEFPDAVTARGAKHLVELAAMVKAGHRAVMMYLVQRTDSPAFTVAGDIDPEYWKGLKTAMKKGVEVLAYGCAVTSDGVTVTKPVPLAL